MVYSYVAYRENGALVKGKLNAKSEEAATDLLNYTGYRVVSLKPYIPFVSMDKLTADMFRVKPAEVTLLFRQLAMLLESGIDIITSFKMLRSQASNRALKRVLTDVIEDLQGGNQLSAAFGKHPKIFPVMYSRLISVGEQTGGLEAVLRQVADYMEKESVTMKNIKNALLYPVITAIVTVGVVILLLTYAMPAFGNLYKQLGLELPAITRALISTADIFKAYGQYMALVLVSLGVGGWFYIRTPSGKYRWDELMLTIPVLGKINHISELAHTCQSMSLLFHAGLPLTETVTLVIQGSGNKAIARALTTVQQDMVKGEGLSGPMAKSKLFLPMMVQMVKVGEETGNLDTTLKAVARSYEAEAEEKTKSLTALIQPAMTIVIGAVIGVIALSLTSAMYSIYGQGF